jgi:hypothetical protein
MTYNPDNVRYCHECKGDLLVEPAKRKWCLFCNPLDITKQLHIKLIDLAPEPQLSYERIYMLRDDAGVERYIEYGYKAIGEAPYLTADGSPHRLRVVHPDVDVARTKWRSLWLEAYLASCSVRLPPKEPAVEPPKPQELSPPRIPQVGEPMELCTHRGLDTWALCTVRSFDAAKNEILVEGRGWHFSSDWPSRNLRFPAAQSRAFEQTAADIARMF